MSSLDAQLIASAVMVLTGALLGLWLDFNRALRTSLTWSSPAASFLDVVLMTGSALLLAGGFFVGNWGEIRFYMLLALGGGLWLYLALASPLLLPAWQRAFRSLQVGGKKALRFLTRLFPANKPN